MADPSRPETHWSLDKRIPLALVLAILAQTTAAIWFFAGLSHQLDEHNRRINAIEAQRAGERLAVIESQIGDVKTLLLEIKSALAEQQRRAR